MQLHHTDLFEIKQQTHLLIHSTIHLMYFDKWLCGGLLYSANEHFNQQLM